MPQKKRKSKRVRKKDSSILPLLLVGSMLFSVAFGIGTLKAVTASDELQTPSDPNLDVVARTLALLLKHDALDLAPIILCESEFKHYNADGTVLQNREGSSAIGIAQIMSSVHPDPKVILRYNKRYDTDITTEDFDLDTFEGNLEYAIVLYRVRGVSDWKCAGQA